LHSLTAFNSFALNTKTNNLLIINHLDDLYAVSKKISQPFYVLGEGSNTLFVEDFAPPIVKIALKGVTITETDEYYKLIVSAGENWHELVTYTITNNIYGLENLALIPGSVGAAPVQNIGAYGVEFADFCHSVTYYDFHLQQERQLEREGCEFSYRDSIFKKSLQGKGVITAVTLHIPKKWHAKLNYAGLNSLNTRITAKDIYDKVIELRQAKLPDPKELPNAGSFFKNPIISNNHFINLQKRYKQIPSYRQVNGDIKIAAGWLIEQAGLKGFRQNRVGIHDKQALVLVNYTNGTGKALIELACLVQQSVYNKFDIKLEPEVRLISKMGEVSLEELCNG
jgi:UDP-N-acetylmuramate dehydrogenase